MCLRRSHPRVMALATVTPCTEDPASPKNRVWPSSMPGSSGWPRKRGSSCCRRARHRTRSRTGRSYRPDYHVTADFVHPGAAEHVAIAVGCSADWVRPRRRKSCSPTTPGFTNRPPKVSHAVLHVAAVARLAGCSARHGSRSPISGLRSPSRTPPLVTTVVPESWTVRPASLTGAKGQFELSGPLDRLENTITLRADAGGETLPRRSSRSPRAGGSPSAAATCQAGRTTPSTTPTRIASRLMSVWPKATDSLPRCRFPPVLHLPGCSRWPAALYRSESARQRRHGGGSVFSVRQPGLWHR